MQTVTSADGTTIAYDRTGDGPPLVLVMGAFCDRHSPAELAERLAADFTVYAYDRRGKGDSDPTPPTTVDREIEDVAAVIGAAGGAAHVFGHSSGAILALEAAAAGLPITRLVAYEPPYVVGDDRSRDLDLIDRVRALLAEGQRSEATELFMVSGPQMSPEAIARVKASPGWAYMTAMAPSLVYDLIVTGDQWTPVDRLGKIDIPTMVMSGGESPDWFVNSARLVASSIDGGIHRSLAGQDHGAAPEVLAPVLLDFFRE
jgi:pimeloyl-ACP methyl ester carboxylesterase